MPNWFECVILCGVFCHAGFTVLNADNSIVVNCGLHTHKAFFKTFLVLIAKCRMNAIMLYLGYHEMLMKTPSGDRKLFFGSFIYFYFCVGC